MKTEEVKIRKIVADDGMIFVSKNKIEEYGLTLPESFFGKEIYLGIDASAEDFEEMPEHAANVLREQRAQLAGELKPVVDEAREIQEKPEEVQEETQDDN